MAKLLLNLRHVPDDEADEVRAVLEESAIAFYETKPSLWGVSAGGIWISRDEDHATAKRLMAEYQHRRLTDARAQYEAARRAGSAATLWTVFREHPWQTLAALLGIAIVVALMILPFVFA